MFVEKPRQSNLPLSYEYIRGLVEGEGCFSFSTMYSKNNNQKYIYKIPAFIISMHERDQELLEMVRDTLGLKNRVYNFKSIQSDRIKRGRKAMLVVRDFVQIKDIIIPLFYKKLRGHKAKQFNEWLEVIGTDPAISARFRSLYGLYKMGVYDNNPKFIEKYI